MALFLTDIMDAPTIFPEKPSLATTCDSIVDRLFILIQMKLVSKVVCYNYIGGLDLTYDDCCRQCRDKVGRCFPSSHSDTAAPLEVMYPLRPCKQPTYRSELDTMEWLLSCMAPKAHGNNIDS